VPFPVSKETMYQDTKDLSLDSHPAQIRRQPPRSNARVTKATESYRSRRVLRQLQPLILSSRHSRTTGQRRATPMASHTASLTTLSTGQRQHVFSCNGEKVTCETCSRADTAADRYHIDISVNSTFACACCCLKENFGTYVNRQQYCADWVNTTFWPMGNSHPNLDVLVILTKLFDKVRSHQRALGKTFQNEAQIIT